ncbi:FAD-dependent oxidoreductase [Amycolatopsis jiangsuensis]|uniref:NADPH-dependent 2,4-dienoyl-CoA reductase/sulfur reductase-like enzyme n=1 Tax=Amycolatopsis jiangsuensis TaxID=1181879 RepID=A0A840IRE2_9PSEU|nr:FAD-dependent oxidoreductase [Amycolatopsis jiangsuensis]MBB4684015.1 NADPH-dependent 2,4-dienoyl-CoA reductase/sulfur reductase-like enzyme [Amycolatopsis jiangsuensis]
MDADELVVLGSGAAGVSAACAYREAGGTGPVRILSADVDPPYERPPLSKNFLRGETSAEKISLLDAGEDHALWRRLGAAGHRIGQEPGAIVRTSARLDGRAPDGLSTLLRRLASGE